MRAVLIAFIAIIGTVTGHGTYHAYFGNEECSVYTDQWCDDFCLAAPEYCPDIVPCCYNPADTPSYEYTPYDPYEESSEVAFYVRQVEECVYTTTDDWCTWVCNADDEENSCQTCCTDTPETPYSFPEYFAVDSPACATYTDDWCLYTCNFPGGFCPPCCSTEEYATTGETTGVWTVASDAVLDDLGCPAVTEDWCRTICERDEVDCAVDAVGECCQLSDAVLHYADYHCNLGETARRKTHQYITECDAGSPIFLNDYANQFDTQYDGSGPVPDYSIRFSNRFDFPIAVSVNTCGDTTQYDTTITVLDRNNLVLVQDDDSPECEVVNPTGADPAEILKTVSVFSMEAGEQVAAVISSYGVSPATGQDQSDIFAEIVGNAFCDVSSSDFQGCTFSSNLGLFWDVAAMPESDNYDEYDGAIPDAIMVIANPSSTEKTVTVSTCDDETLFDTVLYFYNTDDNTEFFADDSLEDGSLCETETVTVAPASIYEIVLSVYGNPDGFTMNGSDQFKLTVS